MSDNELAINGGEPARKTKLPFRKLFGENELKMVAKVFQDSWEKEVDFGYQGEYEKKYIDNFCEFQGGGFADAVTSGTAAIYLSLKSLEIEQGSDVIVSPVTDPGGVAPIIIAGMNPVIADSQPDSYNIGPEQFEAALTPNTRAAILAHIGGQPFNIEPIMDIAKTRDIKVIEDCSQAHGALYNGKRVGCFGDVVAFSTMYSKNHATGGCGGIIYTRNKDLYRHIRSLADRGKPFHNHEFNPKDPGDFLFPSLNYNQDELSCAIGISTLSRLPDIINKRNEIIKKINDRLRNSSVVSPAVSLQNTLPSPYFHTLNVDVEKLKVSKKKFAEAIAAEGIWINPDYRYIVSEWKWLKKYLIYETQTPNAVAFRESSFNLLFNERFSDDNIDDIIACISKVEMAFSK